MAKLIYVSNMSLDGWTEDAHGGFDWGVPDDEVFVAITGLMGSAGTYLYGRRMYETMSVWETEPALAERSDLTRVFADVWQRPEKIVYSTTLAKVPTERTRLEQHFDPAALRDLKATSTSDLLIGGPNLAAQAIRAGLVDELHLIIWPIVLGGRNPALPSGVRVELELLGDRRFPSGAVHLHHRLLPQTVR